MISAFKHIRLSGYNLIPLSDVSYDGSNVLRLSLGNKGLAYYSELTGVSGHLQSLINTANDDVSRINTLGGSVTIQGAAGIGIGVDPATNTITITGADSGYFQGLVDLLSGNLNLTGTHIYANFVRKATQQSFTLDVPQNIDTTGIEFPVPFSSTPTSVNVTLEVPGDVMYMTTIKNKSSAGFTAEFSDHILEAGVKINTFAINPNNT